MMIDFIVPLHNSTSFLPRLIDSLNCQLSNNFCVIFVDDGSEDSPADFLNNYDVKFSYKLLENNDEKGPGAARNLGIRSSQAKYISFIDSDDFVSNDYVSIAEPVLMVSDCDILEYMFKVVDDDDGKTLSLPNIKPYLENHTNRFKQILSGNIGRTSWAKFYNRKNIVENNIIFPSNIHNGEDHIFVLRAYKYSVNIKTLYHSSYSWVRRSGSLTKRAITHKTVQDFISVSLEKKKMISCEDHELFDIYSRRFFKECRMFIKDIKGSEDVNVESYISLVMDFILSVQMSDVADYIKNNYPDYYSDVVLNNKDLFEEVL